MEILLAILLVVVCLLVIFWGEVAMIKIGKYVYLAGMRYGIGLVEKESRSQKPDRERHVRLQSRGYEIKGFDILPPMDRRTK